MTNYSAIYNNYLNSATTLSADAHPSTERLHFIHTVITVYLNYRANPTTVNRLIYNDFIAEYVRFVAGIRLPKYYYDMYNNYPIGSFLNDPEIPF